MTEKFPTGKYRSALDKTQEELAELAGISTNHISNLELGKSEGRLDKYYSVAQALNITVDMLIDNTPERVSANNTLFINQLRPLVSSLSIEQRKLLIEFVELLTRYNIDKSSIE